MGDADTQRLENAGYGTSSLLLRQLAPENTVGKQVELRMHELIWEPCGVS